MTKWTTRGTNTSARAYRPVMALTTAVVLSASTLLPATAAENEPSNIAAEASATASGQEVAGKWGPALTVDGDHGPQENRSDPGVHNATDASRWSANNAEDAWITLRFPREAEIEEVAVDWGNTYATSYSLQVSEDGRQWQDIATDIAGTRDGVVTTTPDAPVEATYLRLQAEGKSSQWPISIWEIEVLGTLLGEPPIPLEESLIPKPQSVDVTGGEPYTFTAQTCISTETDSLAGVADLFRDAVGTSTGLALPDGENCEISFAVDPTLTTGYGQQDEAYRLTADADGVRIVGHSVRGAMWGMRTLVQLLGPWAQAPVEVAVTPTVQAVQILDAPRYAWRGFMLDPARSFWPVDEVKTMLDLMASYKMNVMHMHLSDDQGWRIAIDNEGRAEGDTIDYTNLVERSGQTAYMAGKSDYAPEGGRTGYYTKAEFIDIVSYAATRGIMIVPEIDGPGHANSMLHAIGPLNTDGAFPRPEPGQDRVPPFDESSYAQTTLDPRSEVTYTFLSHVIGQIVADTVAGLQATEHAAAPVSPYFHIGGDESSTTTGDDYTYYMDRASQVVTDNGKTPIVWNEAISAASALPEGTAIQQWLGGVTQETRDFIENKNGKILLSPVPHAYYSQKPTDDIVGPSWACGGACTIERFYNWNPTAMAGVDEADVLGIEGPMWSEHLRTLHDLQFLVFPRLLAHAEVAWTPQLQRQFDDFAQRVTTAGISLLSQGATFQMVPQVQGWYSDFAAAPAREVPASGGEVLLGYLAAPGTADLDEISVTAQLADSGAAARAAGGGQELQVRLEMDQAFHYTDPGRTTGRVMNSLIRVYAQVPASADAGQHEVEVSATTGLGEVAGTAALAVAGPGSDGADGNDGGADGSGSSDDGAAGSADASANSGADGAQATDGADADGAQASDDADADGTGEPGAADDAANTAAAASADAATEAADTGADSAEAAQDGAGTSAGSDASPNGAAGGDDALAQTGFSPAGLAVAGLMLFAGAIILLRRRRSNA